MAPYISPTAIPHTILPMAKSGTIYALGDSITFASETSSPWLYAYPILLGTYYNLPVRNLAIGGVTSTEVLGSQVPQISGPCSLGTVNIGTNDAGAEPGRLAENLQLIVNALKSKCENVVVMTIIANPNIDTQRIPVYASTRDRLNEQIKALSSEITVLELNADPRLHDPANFFQPFNIHPTITGHVVIAQDIEALFEKPAP